MGAGRGPAPDSLAAANTLAKFTEVNQHGAEAAGSHRGRTRPLCLESQSSASSSSRFGRKICRLPIDSMSSFLGSLSSEKRSEEHTSELQSRLHLVCRLLLEKKKKYIDT